jgi:hypothetical protein
MLSAGCGGADDFETAHVRGTVACNGKPLTMGIVSFQPISPNGKMAGKAGYGLIQGDGSFVVSTYGTEDGAVVGRHKVMVLPPAESDRDDAPREVRATRRSLCYQNRKEITLEVKGGGRNEFSIDVHPSK